MGDTVMDGSLDRGSIPRYSKKMKGCESIPYFVSSISKKSHKLFPVLQDKSCSIPYIFLDISAVAEERVTDFNIRYFIFKQVFICRYIFYFASELRDKESFFFVEAVPGGAKKEF